MCVHTHTHPTHLLTPTHTKTTMKKQCLSYQDSLSNLLGFLAAAKLPPCYPRQPSWLVSPRACYVASMEGQCTVLGAAGPRGYSGGRAETTVDTVGTRTSRVGRGSGKISCRRGGSARAVFREAFVLSHTETIKALKQGFGTTQKQVLSPPAVYCLFYWCLFLPAVPASLQPRPSPGAVTVHLLMMVTCFGLGSYRTVGFFGLGVCCPGHVPSVCIALLETPVVHPTWVSQRDLA